MSYLDQKLSLFTMPDAERVAFMEHLLAHELVV